jgi:hypothetical protein
MKKPFIKNKSDIQPYDLLECYTMSIDKYDYLPVAITSPIMKDRSAEVKSVGKKGVACNLKQNKNLALPIKQSVVGLQICGCSVASAQ